MRTLGMEEASLILPVPRANVMMKESKILSLGGLMSLAQDSATELDCQQSTM